MPIRPPALPTGAAGALALVLALAACGPPPEADLPVSERAREASDPVLLPTETFAAPRAEVLASAAELETDAAALSERAAALRARAAAMSEGPVMSPEERARLEAAPGRIAAEP